MSENYLRSKLVDLIGKVVVVQSKGKDGATESVLTEVGVDYILLKCRAESNGLIIPLDAISSIIEKS